MRYLALLCLLAVTACQFQDPQPPSDNDTMPDPNDCGADKWQSLLGEPAVAAARIPEPKRVIGPDQAVTMDYRPERTNVDLNTAGRIIRIRCG